MDAGEALTTVHSDMVVARKTTFVETMDALADQKKIIDCVAHSLEATEGKISQFETQISHVLVAGRHAFKCHAVAGKSIGHARARQGRVQAKRAGR